LTTLYDNHSQIEIVPGDEEKSAFLPYEGEARDVYLRAWQLGIVAGLRSMMPLALLAWTKENASKGNSQAIKYLAGLAALGETVVDKLPIVPSRLRPGSLTGRLALGALAGMLLSRRFGQRPLPGAINGMLGAGLGSLVGFAARFVLSDATKLPDFLWAGLEDAIALRLGLHALKRERQD
jgi:uncharacterized membrane protein